MSYCKETVYVKIGHFDKSSKNYFLDFRQKDLFYLELLQIIIKLIHI